MKYLLLLIFYLVLVNIIPAQSINVTGDWYYTIPNSDIIEAGEDFTGTYESGINQTYVDIEYNSKWEVFVHKVNIDWNNTFILSVRRTGNGFGQKRVLGGTNYRKIKNRTAKIFSGDRDRFSIPLQYKIEKVSVTIPAHTYIVEIVYTVKAK